jgi:hypothetical protein
VKWSTSLGTITTDFGRSDACDAWVIVASSDSVDTSLPGERDCRPLIGAEAPRGALDWADLGRPNRTRDRHERGTAEGTTPDSHRPRAGREVLRLAPLGSGPTNATTPNRRPNVPKTARWSEAASKVSAPVSPHRCSRSAPFVLERPCPRHGFASRFDPGTLHRESAAHGGFLSQGFKLTQDFVPVLSHSDISR